MLDPQEWELARGARRGRVRPPADRHVAAVPARARAALPGVLERGGLQRRVGQARRAARREGAPGARPRALGGVRRPRSIASWSCCATSATGAGPPPATIVALSGDVHHAYLAEVGFPPGTGMRAAASTRRRARRSATRSTSTSGGRSASPAAGRARSWAAAGARRAGRRPAGALALHHDEPFFDNQVCFLELDGRRARLELQKTVPEENEGYSLEPVFAAQLA